MPNETDQDAEQRSPRYRICICTTTERERGLPFRGCMAHEAPPIGGTCGHTVAEGCTGHGDF